MLLKTERMLERSEVGQTSVRLVFDIRPKEAELRIWMRVRHGEVELTKKVLC
jgi:hypothetical protein